MHFGPRCTNPPLRWALNSCFDPTGMPQTPLALCLVILSRRIACPHVMSPPRCNARLEHGHIAGSQNLPNTLPREVAPSPFLFARLNFRAGQIFNLNENGLQCHCNEALLSLQPTHTPVLILGDGRIPSEQGLRSLRADLGLAQLQSRPVRRSWNPHDQYHCCQKKRISSNG